MKRRRRVVPFVLAGALLMLVGLGAYSGESREHIDYCKEDPEGQWEYCEAGRGEVPDQFADAYVNICFLDICPDQAKAASLGHLEAPPCNDMYGARFWHAVGYAESRCLDALDRIEHGYKKVANRIDLREDEAFHECLVTKTLQQCPELGPNWYARFEAEAAKDVKFFDCPTWGPLCYRTKDHPLSAPALPASPGL